MEMFDVMQYLTSMSEESYSLLISNVESKRDFDTFARIAKRANPIVHLCVNGVNVQTKIIDAMMDIHNHISLLCEDQRISLPDESNEPREDGKVLVPVKDIARLCRIVSGLDGVDSCRYCPYSDRGDCACEAVWHGEDGCVEHLFNSITGLKWDEDFDSLDD